jgi:hypothetical protein
VFVLVVGVWRGKPDNKFGEFECGEQADYRWLTPGPGAAGLPEPTRSFKKLVVMMPPVTGGAYFQHFIDRGWTKLMQVWYAFASWCRVAIPLGLAYTVSLVASRTHPCLVDGRQGHVGGGS